MFKVQLFVCFLYRVFPSPNIRCIVLRECAFELREMKKMQRRLSVKYSTYAVVKRKPEKVPTLPTFNAPFGFLAQLVRALHQYRRGQDSNPNKPEFFPGSGSFRSCIGCVFNRDDLLGIFLPSAAFNRKRRLIVRHGNIP